MKRTALYDSVIIGKNDGAEEELKVSYYIICEKNDDEPEGRGRYGVIAEKELSDGCIERAEVGNICSTDTEAAKFIDMLVRNKVTPMYLREIAEEYVISRIKYVCGA